MTAIEVELLKAAEENDHVKLRDLIKHRGASPNYATKKGETAIWFACRNFCLDCLKILIDFNADLNARLETGVTGLWIAAANGHVEVIEMLLNAGADLNIADTRGITPLWTAAAYGFYYIVRRLLKSGADCDSAKSDGQTCLWVACQSNFKQIVEILVEHGANLDLARNDGHTPLMAAAEGGFVEIVQILIDNRATVDSRCANGRTALSLAACNGHDQVVMQLISAGANPYISRLQQPFNLQACPLTQSCTYARMSTACLLWDRVSDGQKQQAIKICAMLGYEDLKVRLSTLGSSFFRQESSKNHGELSDLARAMKQSGFTKEKSRVLAAAADIVQDIFRCYFRKDYFFVLGSFGDGLGCNLRVADGSIGTESDVDFAEIMPGQKFHIKDFCNCEGVAEEDKVAYMSGHIRLNGRLSVGSRPAMTTQASPVTPSMDVVYAYAACCYPRLSIINDGPDELGHFPPEIVAELKRQVALPDHPFHLIRAGTPDEEGTQLRVSTSILEQIVLRLLTTEQCQFYIVLKFIVKEVLGASNKDYQSIGLKSYHAKSLLLFMLKETEERAWIDNIQQLLISALTMLKNFMISRSEEKDYCMPHFFLGEAVLYLKKFHSSKSHIVAHITHIINNTDQCLHQFMNQLKPLETKNQLSLHIFTLFPFGFSLFDDSNASENEFHNAYIQIKSYLTLAFQMDATLTEEMIVEIDNLPDFVRTAKLCLRALINIRKGPEGENVAKRLILEHSKSERGYANRFISLEEADSSELIKKNILEELRNCDSIWRICCRIDLDSRLSCGLLVCPACFPSRLPNHERRLYLNFDVLLQLLKLRVLNRNEIGSVFDWSASVIESSRSGADFEELFAAAQIATDVSKKRQALQAMLELFSRRHEKTDAIISQILGWQDGCLDIEHDSNSKVCFRSV